MTETRWSDRRIVLWIAAVMAVLIVAVSVLAPATDSDDSRPSTYNTGPQGAKAAFLTLQAIGRKSSRWERPINELNSADAAHSTLVLAAPAYAPPDRDEIAAAIKQFMDRGGHVLTTGPMGALLLPNGAVQPATTLITDACETSPGDGPLAAAGRAPMDDDGAWDAKGEVEVGERCGHDAVVVRMKVGHGEAVWWSSARPLTNRALKTDADLRLFLLSVGDGRAVIWDESLHAAVPGLWSTAHGLPLRWLVLQVALLAILVILSFSRRKGPIRTPVVLPRTSPLEFAISMGDLYEKARATTAATDAARRRLLRAIVRDAGVPQSAVASGSQAVVSALNERLGGDWSSVAAHLEKARHENGDALTNREAVAISRALSQDAENIRATARRRRTRPATSVKWA